MISIGNELTVFTYGSNELRTEIIEGCPWFIARDLCISLGLTDTNKALQGLDDDEKLTRTLFVSGQNREVRLVNEPGMYSLILRSRKAEAKEFKRWITHEVLPAIRKTGHYETPEYKAILELKANQEHLEKLLIDSGILRTNVNPRYTFDRLNVRYKIATCDDGVRGFYDSIGNYFGINVPYSNTINVTVKDWIIAKLDMDELQEFVVGLETGMITKSLRGHYVNLNGFGGNNIEWQKILDSFGHQCAYCGCDDKALIPEHIVSQSYLSQSNPEAVDLIGNIVPACGSCNKSKNTQDVDEWYPTHPQFKQWKLDKIHKHQAKYRLEV